MCDVASFLAAPSDSACPPSKIYAEYTAAMSGNKERTFIMVKPDAVQVCAFALDKFA